MMSNKIHNHPDYMVHMHVKELDWLSRLSIRNGEIIFDTGAILQPVIDRIKMYEDMIARNQKDYAPELERLETEKNRQREHLRSM